MTSFVVRRGIAAFTIIWFGQLISQLGSGMTRFALGVWLYQTSGSTTQLALVSLWGTLPNMLLSPFLGTLVDRWDRRVVMIGSTIGSGASMLAIALLSTLGQLAVWHIYVAVAVNAALSALLWLAFTASVTLLVPGDQLGRVSGALQLPQTAEFILSPVLGSVVLLSFGLTGVLLLDAATFLIALLALCVVQIPRARSPLTAAARPQAMRDELLYGWRFLRDRSGLLALTVLQGSAGLVLGIVSVLVTPLVLTFTTSSMLGVVMSIGGSGMVVGSLLMSVWGGPARRVWGVLSCMALEGACIMLGGLRPSVPLFTIAAFGFFFGVPVVRACCLSILQQKVPADVQGRVFAISDMIAWSALPVGYLVAGPLADYLFEPLLQEGGLLVGSVGQIIGVGPGRGIGLLFITMGLLYLLLVAASLLYRPLRDVEAALPDATGAGSALAGPAGIEPSAVAME